MNRPITFSAHPVSAEFVMEMTDEGERWMREAFKPQPRDITLTLNGKVPDDLKRDRLISLDLEVGDQHTVLQCRVLRRRLNRVWLREVIR